MDRRDERFVEMDQGQRRRLRVERERMRRHVGIERQRVRARQVGVERQRVVEPAPDMHLVERPEQGPRHAAMDRLGANVARLDRQRQVRALGAELAREYERQRADGEPALRGEAQPRG